MLRFTNQRCRQSRKRQPTPLIFLNVDLALADLYDLNCTPNISSKARCNLDLAVKAAYNANFYSD